MRIPLKRATLSATAVLAAAAAVLMGGGVPAGVHYVGHDKVTQVMSKVRSAPIVSDPGLIVLAQRRDAGPVEYHDINNHVFIFVEGEATLIVGGTMVDAKRTAPNEMRAPSVMGGTTYHVSKGDVITIPAKTPHWFKEVPTKTIAYYAVNIGSEGK